MAVQLVAAAASQLINSSTNISLPIQLPGTLAMANKLQYSINVWIRADWGTSAAPRGTKSFVGLYGPMTRTPGLAAAYYDNKLLTEPYSVVRADPNVNLNLASGVSPATGVNGNAYSIRWVGYWTCPTTSAYWYFRTNSDDGVRVYVNGVLKIDLWTDHSATVSTSATATSLVAGTEYPIIVEYYNQGGEAVCSLSAGVGTLMGGSGVATFTVIPSTQLNTSANPGQTTTALQIGSITGSGEISCWTYGGAIQVQTAKDLNPALNNQWINVGYTWDGFNHLLYVNGFLAASGTGTQIPGTLKYITINGYWPGGAGETDNHYVDSYSLYNRILSADEMQTIFYSDGARHGIWNGLVANYEFDEYPEGTSLGKLLDDEVSAFAVLANTAVTNTAVSTLTGMLGTVNANASGITGFSGTLTNDGPGTATGAKHQGTATAILASGQINTARARLTSMGAGTALGTTVTGLTLTPGVYTITAAASNLAGTLTLDAQNQTNATWVFQCATTFITTAGSIINLINAGGNTAIYFNVGSSATINANTQFVGNILANTSITVGAGCKFLGGRLLAYTGAITLNTNQVNAQVGPGLGAMTAIAGIPDLTGGGATLLTVGAAAAPKYSYQNSHADSNVRPPVTT